MSSLSVIFQPNGPIAPVLRALCTTFLIASQILTSSAAQAQLLPGMGGEGDMTASAERQLGDSVARELYRDPDYLDDPVLVEYVQGIWQRLLTAARQRGELTPELDERFAWQVLLGRDADINAFALPGGYLGLNLGLIAIVGSRDELATVLGHELSHVTQRHIARMLAREKQQTPLLVAAMVLGLLAVAKSRTGDAGQAIMMGGQALAMQNQLKFSRDMEREADRIGFGVMTQAGFAPQGAAEMFEKLQYASRLSDNGTFPYLRSHPMTGERIADMRSRFQMNAAAPVPAGTGVLPLAMDQAMISARAGVLTRPGVDVLRLRVDAASGGEFDKSSPAQQAGVLYAAALAASRLRDFKAAQALAARLVARTGGDPNAPRGGSAAHEGASVGAPILRARRLARLLAAEIALAAGDASRAAGMLDAKATARPEMLLAAQAAIADHRPAPMVPTLRDWVAMHRRDATAWRTLATLYSEQGEPVRAVRADAEANVAILDYPAARDRFKAAQELVRQSARGGPGVVPVDHFEASIIDARAREVEALVKQQAAETLPH